MSSRYQAIQAQIQALQRRAQNPVTRALDALRARAAAQQRPRRTYGSRMRRP